MFTKILSTAFVIGLTATAAMAEFPEREIQGIIQWGAGGSTDSVMRSVTPHAEAALGGSIVMQNVTGGVGAIALNQVSTAKADGYTVLMGAENPLLYKVMGFGEKDYFDFTPIMLLGRGTPILVAGIDAPFDTYPEMIAYIAENPDEVRFGSHGPGGLSSVIYGMMQAEEELPVILIPYDGDGPALTALQGKAIDVMAVVQGAAIEGIRAGTMKPIVLFDTEQSETLPDVPTITSTNPEFETFLPWGPFFGIFAPNGTPDDVVGTLRAAYAQAVQAPDFVDLMHNRGFSIMGTTGQEAVDFLTNWQRNTAWLMHDAGVTKYSPEDFGITRP
ncbi:tripartite tricarboxylate transporter substrate binding protein [Pacificibacter sp.]|uniref:Bug family tripartite tricarboxylate transporter substrate binding protein n=1 Tax=Pacificibacter sp. TaxID=1917866 RepID=UPI00321A38BB